MTTISYCYNCEREFEPITYRFIYCLINKETGKCNYFSEPPEFAFDYDCLKVEYRRVKDDSVEYFVALQNSIKMQSNPFIIS
jgi:hypothetical protein